MLAWVIPATWEAMKVLAFILQLVGVLGLIAGCIMALMDISEFILEVSEDGESQAGPGEEDSSVQPGL